MSAENTDEDSSQELLQIFVAAKRERFTSSSLLKHLFTFYEDRYHIQCEGQRGNYCVLTNLPILWIIQELELHKDQTVTYILESDHFPRQWPTMLGNISMSVDTSWRDTLIFMHTVNCGWVRGDTPKRTPQSTRGWYANDQNNGT